jgi:hypothetical protein
MVLQPPIPAKDTTQPLDETVVITVRGQVYELAGDVFTNWRAREVAADITDRTGAPYSEVVVDVIDAYIAALDGTAEESAA